MDLTFNKLCDAAELTANIVTGGLTQGNRFFGVSCSSDGVTVVHLPDDSTSAEQTIVNTAVTNYNGLASAKATKIAVLHDDCQNYILAHYDTGRQASLNALLTEAVIKSYPNRIAYIAQALAWIKSCISYYYTQEDAINTATTISDANNVTWDFKGQLDSTDPQITLRDAENLTN